MPFVKNNPRQNEAIGGEAGADLGAPVEKKEEVKTARQREIEALKRSLLAPLPGRAGAPAV